MEKKILTSPTQTLPTRKKSKRSEHFLIYFVKSAFSLIPKPDKDSTRKKKKKDRPIIPDEHTWQNPHKMLANLVQQHNLIHIHHNQVEFIPGMQG